MQQRHAFAEFVPLSAQKAADVERLLAIVEPYLPEQPWLYDADALTDRSDRFLAAEIVREKLFRLTGDELPYTSTVVIDKYEEEGGLRRIAATIVVERDAHKGMIIGAGGERLKRIGSESRQELERLLDARVFLELWVKVRSGWADDEAHLRSYGNSAPHGLLSKRPRARPRVDCTTTTGASRASSSISSRASRAGSRSPPRARSGRSRSCAARSCRSSACRSRSAARLPATTRARCRPCAPRNGPAAIRC